MSAPRSTVVRFIAVLSTIHCHRDKADIAAFFLNSIPPKLHGHLLRKSITDVNKLHVPVPRPTARSLTIYDHGPARGHDHKAEYPKHNEAVLHSRVYPVTGNKGEEHGYGIVDDSDTHHALKNHITTGKLAEIDPLG